MPDYIGWMATATFASSYFCKRPAILRRVQGLAALLWIGYGIWIHALPVIVANTVVATVAVISSFWPASRRKLRQSRTGEALASNQG